jgi:hypothetical protein
MLRLHCDHVAKMYRCCEQLLRCCEELFPCCEHFSHVANRDPSQHSKLCSQHRTSLHNIQIKHSQHQKSIQGHIVSHVGPMWRATSKHQGPPPSPLDTTLNITCLQHRRSTSTTSKINVCDIKNC